MADVGQEHRSCKSPFTVGYPDPAIDGAFDPTLIPFGGPYPPTRDFDSDDDDPTADDDDPADSTEEEDTE